MTSYKNQKGKFDGPIAHLKVLDLAACDKNLHLAALRALIVLANFADIDGSCFPSRRTIASRLGVSISAVTRQIKILRQAGYIQYEARFRGKTQTSNLYFLNHNAANQYAENPGQYSIDRLMFEQRLMTTGGNIVMLPGQTLLDVSRVGNA